ncbi:MAG: tryptophan 7-halogenase [Proteobacteria bacterium]|nr:tryptophan 7-halogenase [Pseudomonadota bacterium]
MESIVWEKDESITQVRDASGQKKEIAARFIIDSSGYGRVIPRLLQLDQASDLPGRQTYFAHMSDEKRLEFAEPNRITIVMADNNVWVWMIPFSSGVTSVGFVGTPENFVNLKGSNGEIFKALIDRQPQVAARFGDQKFIWEPRKLEGWSVTTNRFYGEGFVLTGNVTEFLDPIFSSGVTLAVVSGARAAHVVANKLNGLPFDWEEDYMKPTMSGVDVFRTYVKSWYDGTLADVFFAKEIAPSFKGQICSVLAGYVWDQSNPFVAQHDRALKNLASVIRLQRG